jgi:hypothetical protein
VADRPNADLQPLGYLVSRGAGLDQRLQRRALDPAPGGMPALVDRLEPVLSKPVADGGGIAPDKRAHLLQRKPLLEESFQQSAIHAWRIVAGEADGGIPSSTPNPRPITITMPTRIVLQGGEYLVVAHPIQQVTAALNDDDGAFTALSRPEVGTPDVVVNPVNVLYLEQFEEQSPFVDSPE